MKGFTTISISADHIAWVEVATVAWTGGVSTAAWRGPALIAVLWPLTCDVATALSSVRLLELWLGAETDSSHTGLYQIASKKKKKNPCTRLDNHHLSILDEDP
jgi:hypothetical protein